MLVKAVYEHLRDDSSQVLASMKVVRPDWQRKFKLQSWTSGNDNSLVRFIEPVKDFGNATLTKKNQVWTYNPKTRRVIKIPPSMKAQSWMGSDFSYQDLAREDDMVYQYVHTISQIGEGFAIVTSTPKDDAPVVWGKEVLKIRKDRIVEQHDFYDQDGLLVKRLTAHEIGEIGGKVFPIQLRMEKSEEEGTWTEIVHEKATFNLKLSPQVFTISSLQNPK
jgi:outer membrane lipoprotein-sorting protein